MRAFWRNIFRRGEKRVDQELDEEIRGYVELMAAEKVRCGMAPEEACARGSPRNSVARNRSRKAFATSERELSMDTLMQDLRYAFRTLRRNLGLLHGGRDPLTLALGIGANTTIFTVVNGVLLKPLPYPEPDRLLMLWERQSDGTLGTVAPANFFDWREQIPALLTRWRRSIHTPDFILNGAGRARQRLAGAAVSADLFPLLGVRMALGRETFCRKRTASPGSETRLSSSATPPGGNGYLVVARR